MLQNDEDSVMQGEEGRTFWAEAIACTGKTGLCAGDLFGKGFLIIPAFILRMVSAQPTSRVVLLHQPVTEGLHAHDWTLHKRPLVLFTL